jgi:hypothetical protein
MHISLPAPCQWSKYNKDVVGNGEGNLNAPDVSTRFLENGSFVRLQNLSLGYNVNTKSTFVKSLRLHCNRSEPG